MEQSVKWLAVATIALAVAIVIATLGAIVAFAPKSPTPLPAESDALRVAHGECNDTGSLAQIDDESMRTTLEPGDAVLLTAYASTNEIERGDVVWMLLTDSPPGGSQFKRVIGIGGDTVQLRDRGVYLNGALVPEPYASGPVAETNWSVGPSELFVMGDNRENSFDS